jgi:hypothetical protein
MRGNFLENYCRELGLGPKIDIMGARRIGKRNGINTEGRDYDDIVSEAMEGEFG